MITILYVLFISLCNNLNFEPTEKKEKVNFSPVLCAKLIIIMTSWPRGTKVCSMPKRGSVGDQTRTRSRTKYSVDL